jgi:hypothetical protein
MKAPRLMSTYKLWTEKALKSKSNVVEDIKLAKGYQATDHKNWSTFCEKKRNCIIVSMQNSCEVFHPHLWLSTCRWKPDEWNKMVFNVQKEKDHQAKWQQQASSPTKAWLGQLFWEYWNMYSPGMSPAIYEPKLSLGPLQQYQVGMKI